MRLRTTRPRRPTGPLRTAAGLTVTACAVVGVLVTGALVAVHRAHTVHVALESQTVALAAGGDRSLVPPGDLAVPLPTPGQQDWLDQGTVPGAGTAYGPMVGAALLDLHTLTLDNGAAAAGWSTPWRYVWPRDAAFTAAAFARTGHLDDAERVLTFLQGVQEPDGTFHARYLTDGSGVPDHRGIELDGSGWVLWGTAQVAAGVSDPVERRALVRRLQPLVDRAAAACARLATADDGLPPASLDYWETNETVVTLGTAAPLLAGLEAARDLYTTLGRTSDAVAVGLRATALDDAISATFAVQGYPRTLGGHDRDAAVTFLMPPFRSAAGAPSALLEAWTKAQTELLRPAGGLAPGAGWKDDGISWTPETALFALTAAADGRDQVATGWLDWLDRHRTRAGSLPEKVLSDGSPAAVAPLAWTAAAVVLAVSYL